MEMERQRSRLKDEISLIYTENEELQAKIEDLRNELVGILFKIMFTFLGPQIHFCLLYQSVNPIACLNWNTHLYVPHDEWIGCYPLVLERDHLQNILVVMGHDICCQGINLAAVLQGIFMMKERKIEKEKNDT